MLLTISDLHLGRSNVPEKYIYQLLTLYAPKADTIILLGDICDLQLSDYKTSIPKTINLLNHLLFLVQDHTEIIYIVGNHDERVAELIRSGRIQIVDGYIERYGTMFAHGHEFDPSNKLYAFLDKINFGGNVVTKWIGRIYDKRSRSKKSNPYTNDYLYNLKMFLGSHGRHIPSFIFGHTHAPMQDYVTTAYGQTLITNTGGWPDGKNKYAIVTIESNNSIPKLIRV